MMPWMKLRYCLKCCYNFVICKGSCCHVWSGTFCANQTFLLNGKLSYLILFLKYCSWCPLPYSHYSLPVTVKTSASAHCRSFTRGPVLHSVAMDDVTAHRGSRAFGSESDRYKLILCHKVRSPSPISERKITIYLQVFIRTLSIFNAACLVYTQSSNIYEFL